jgi:hypothetical protein
LQLLCGESSVHKINNYLGVPSTKYHSINKLEYQILLHSQECMNVLVFVVHINFTTVVNRKDISAAIVEIVRPT